jgi:transcriptional antiterminator RfaH
MKRWFAAYTQPRQETVASDHLARQNFEVFFPRYLKRRSHARRVDFLPAPLFPRYLFVAFSPEENGWRAIRSTRGVVDLVRNGIDPISVPDAIIEEMRSRQDQDGLIVLARHLKLDRGDRIRIETGPFASYEAIFQTQRDEERVIALLSLLGRKVVVDVPIDAVVPAT